jgi:PIN domain nuclease of toxin-antitoxin system
MTLLLDTHLLLWAVAAPERISPGGRALLSAPEHSLAFSAASLWEVAIKSALGRADFCVDVGLLRRALLANGYLELPVTGEHTIELARLPPLHRDPFDRILVCQARTLGCPLVTTDRVVAGYGAPVRCV